MYKVKGVGTRQRRDVTKMAEVSGKKKGHKSAVSEVCSGREEK